MARTLAVLKGATPAQAIKEFPGTMPRGGAMTLAEATALLGGASAPASTPTSSRSVARRRAPPTTRRPQKAPASAGRS